MCYKYLISTIAFFLLSSTIISAQSSREVVGKWNLTVQSEDGNFPAWLEVKRSGPNTMVGSYVGYEGSARPISEIHYSEQNKAYSFSIPPQWKRIDDNLKFEFKLENNQLSGTKRYEQVTLNWTGERAPDLIRDEPPSWGNPVNLLDPKLTKWIIPENNQFVMIDGVLVNRKVGGNLITTERFDDFKIHLEFRYPERSNSGLYLRGRYEIQIADNYGQKPYDQLIGSIYGHITPSVNASKKADEWQTLDVTLVGRMVTIVLNGVEVVSNQSIPGMTGGALDSNENEPGPIMIQGDHGLVEFRKIVIVPAY
ncbi:MAG: DUF1080 domain-containing protein [Balneolales bacterium]